MAPAKHSPAVAETWHGIRVCPAISVSGGSLSRPAILDVLQVRDGDREVQMAAVGPQEVWLCEAVANKAVSKRPLGRCTLFTVVRDLVRGELAVADEEPAVAVSDARMADLNFDSDDAPEVCQPDPKRARVRKSKGSSTNLSRNVTVPPLPSAVAVPNGAAGNAGNTFLAHIAGPQGRKLYVELDALPWFVSRLRAEYVGEPEPESSENSGSPTRGNIWWDFRDESWVARMADSRIRVSVRPRMRPGFDFAGLSFDDARARALEEIKGKVDAA